MLEGFLRREDVTRDFGFGRLGHPAFALGWPLKKKIEHGSLFVCY
jgi:hypothetical protein